MSSSLGAGLFGIRAATARFLAPVALVIGFVLLAQQGWGSGEWNDALREVVNCCLYAGLVVGACSAVDASRTYRREPDQILSGRGFTAAWIHIVGSAFWGIAVLAVMTFTVIARTAAYSEWRTPNLAIPAVGAGWMIAVSAIGWLIGSRLPSFISVPVMVLIVWLLNATLSLNSDGYVALLSSIDDSLFVAQLEPVSAVLCAQVLIFLAIAIVAVTAARWSSAPLGSRVAGVITGVIMIGVAASLIATHGPARRKEVVDGSGSCVTLPIQACSWPDHVRGRAIVLSMGEAMWAPLDEAGVPLPDGVVDDGLVLPEGWLGVPMLNANEISTADDLSYATVVWLWCGGTGNALDGGIDDLYQRQLWFKNQVHPIDSGFFSAELTAVMKQTSTEQATWVARKPPGAQCVTR